MAQLIGVQGGVGHDLGVDDGLERLNLHLRDDLDIDLATAS
jgi:hypothetical protein